MKHVQQLYNEMDGFDYGTIINGKRYDDDSYYDIDFGKDFRTLPVKDIEKYKIGNCWDMVNYQHDRFKKQGLNDKSYFYLCQRSDDPNDVITHAFSVVEIGGKKYWFEQAFYSQRGIHPVDSYKDVVNKLTEYYNVSDRPCDVFQYNPDGLDKGLTDVEFFDSVTAGDPVYQRKRGRGTQQ